MAHIGSVWAQPSWLDDVWALGTWANAVIPNPTPVQPEGGGRRIYDPDEHRTKTRRLTKKEWRELDRMFRENAAPRYVAPTEKPAVTKRTTPVAPLVFTTPEPVRTAHERIVAAKHFTALDALESVLDRLEFEQPLIDRHAQALAHTERLRAEAARMAEQQAAADRAWQAAESLRMEQQRQADDEEMLMVLLALHDSEI